MTKLSTCTKCDGFMPSDASSCPHCDSPVRRPRASLARRLLSAAGGGAVAMTLMACYGAAPSAYYEPQEPIRQSQCDPGMDQDNDGSCQPQDCDDANPSISPEAPDIAGDGLDQNCDGSDGVAAPLSFATPPPIDQPLRQH